MINQQFTINRTYAFKKQRAWRQISKVQIFINITKEIDKKVCFIYYTYMYNIRYFRYFMKVSGHLHNTGQFLVFRADREAKVRVNITGGPLAYHYQFEEIYIHYGMDNDYGSEHRINNYAFPAETTIARALKANLVQDCTQKTLRPGLISYKLAVAAVDVHTDVSRLYRLDRLPVLFALNRPTRPIKSSPIEIEKKKCAPDTTQAVIVLSVTTVRNTATQHSPPTLLLLFVEEPLLQVVWGKIDWSMYKAERKTAFQPVVVADPKCTMVANRSVNSSTESRIDQWLWKSALRDPENPFDGRRIKTSFLFPKFVSQLINRLLLFLWRVLGFALDLLLLFENRRHPVVFFIVFA
ncbi:Carbonic anhydrase-related protein 10 [Melipona quadrifasciata]|uniref:Carbonic anhydrase-related protein 10 n=2 Tax=Meliponini TaxID=83319 RepID=A0A0M8ZSG1_9HYME|nr:Carbonic anhydrase-related protein 10 [Melipona quadrifasciata]